MVNLDADNATRAGQVEMCYRLLREWRQLCFFPRPLAKARNFTRVPVRRGRGIATFTALPERTHLFVDDARVCQAKEVEALTVSAS